MLSLLLWHLNVSQMFYDVHQLAVSSVPNTQVNPSSCKHASQYLLFVETKLCCRVQYPKPQQNQLIALRTSPPACPFFFRQTPSFLTSSTSASPTILTPAQFWTRQLPLQLLLVVILALGCTWWLCLWWKLCSSSLCSAR